MSPYDFDNAVLCYIDGTFAYFTTQKLSDAWGDDWNEAPYEHKAGTPDEPIKGRSEDFEKDGEPKWEIIKVAFDGDLTRPCDGRHNSPYSVEMINKGEVAWLAKYSHEEFDTQIEIFAGVSLREFIDLVNQAGGKVYIETPSWSLPKKYPKL